MNNEELKKKIVEIIDASCSFYSGSSVHMDDEQEKAIADALIAAGIGDVKEAEKEYRDAIFLAVTSQTMTSERSRYIELNKNIAEHRAEVAEKALKHAVNVYIAHTETSSKKKWWYKYFLREAEKKLAEENGEKKKI